MRVSTILLIISSCFISQFRMLAQNRLDTEYLVLKTGDTLYGEVDYIDEGAVSNGFYKRIRLKNAKGKTKRYKRDAIMAFKFGNNQYHSYWLSQSSNKIVLVNPKYDIDNKNGEQYFLKLVNKDKLSHYQLEWFDQGNSTLWSMALLKRENDPFFIRADQGILGLKRKVLKNYFYDCPTLKEKIENKEISEVFEITDFYNTNCNK